MMTVSVRTVQLQLQRRQVSSLTEVPVGAALVGGARVVDASAGRAAGHAVGGHDRARRRSPAAVGGGVAARRAAVRLHFVRYYYNNKMFIRHG